MAVPDTDTVSYAVDYTPHPLGVSEDEVINEVKNTTDKLSFWFHIVSIKINPDRFHLLLSNTKGIEINICNEKISNSHSEKLLAVTLDRKLSFEEHVEKLCARASQKVSAHARISNS